MSRTSPLSCSKRCLISFRSLEDRKVMIPSYGSLSPHLKTSFRFGDGLSKRDCESIRIEEDGEPNSLALPFRWTYHRANSFTFQIFVDRVDIIHIEADTGCTGKLLLTLMKPRLATTVQGESRATGLELGPVWRLKSQLEAEHVPVEADRALHVGNHDHR